VIQEELAKKDEYIDMLRGFFDAVDEDHNGEVSYDEFCKLLKEPGVHAFAASLQIDVTDARQFFHILSGNGRVPVDLETFVIGCIKLRGQARSVDLVQLLTEHRRTAVESAEGLRLCLTSLMEIEHVLHDALPDSLRRV